MITIKVQIIDSRGRAKNREYGSTSEIHYVRNERLVPLVEEHLNLTVKKVIDAYKEDNVLQTPTQTPFIPGE